MKSQILDIPTRWNTTYDMLVRALEQKATLTEAYSEAIVADAAVDDDDEINDEDYETKSIDDEYDKSDINWNICEELVDCLQKFYSAVSHFSGSYYPTFESKQSPIAPSSSASSSSSSKRFPGCEFWKQQVVMSHESRRSANSNELSLYLDQQYDIDESDFDLLAWWKGNTKKFPLLSRMARDVLAVPVSTIPLDKVFKQDEVQIWEKENLLGDESVERTECLKDWIRAERRMQGLEEIDKDFLVAFETEFEEKCNMTDEIREFTEAEVKEHLSKLH
ncbi:hypothetical protein KY290_018768 [Solanum tuberosum]|uniref:HAT C-terminal dimerisation domain-containing protein n=1 Tax=Solanum tuberosum TaxID=4113 RepID=A0ABQ7VF56_SOLTU|nr:hypothetical protein KY290_018768 [Solanum tuberosum]